MPFFFFPLPILPGTTEMNPYVADLPCIRGIIHYLTVYFPPGHQGESEVRVFKKGSQIFPWNAEAAAKGDDAIIGPPQEWIEFEDPPYVLQVKATNTSVDQTREAVVMVGILPREILMPEKKLTDYLIAFLRRFKVPV